MDLQTLQIQAFPVCYNYVRLRNRVSIKNMHVRAKLLSLEQRRQRQILVMMFIYKQPHNDIHRVYNRRTQSAEVYAFVEERYNCVKYRNSPYYIGSILWESLPLIVHTSETLIEFKRH